MHLGILTQYMQDTGNIIITQCFGCRATRMPTESSVIPISHPRGSSLMELFPGTLLLMRLGILGTLKASTRSWQESPYNVSHLKSPGQPLHNRSRPQASTRENEALCEEESWSRTQMMKWSVT